jgi:hypothetical protein
MSHIALNEDIRASWILAVLDERVPLRQRRRELGGSCAPVPSGLVW